MSVKLLFNNSTAVSPDQPELPEQMILMGYLLWDDNDVFGTNDYDKMIYGTYTEADIEKVRANGNLQEIPVGEYDDYVYGAGTDEGHTFVLVPEGYHVKYGNHLAGWKEFDVMDEETPHVGTKLNELIYGHQYYLFAAWLSGGTMQFQITKVS